MFKLVLNTPLERYAKNSQKTPWRRALSLGLIRTTLSYVNDHTKLLPTVLTYIKKKSGRKDQYLKYAAWNQKALDSNIKYSAEFRCLISLPGFKQLKSWLLKSQ